MKKMCKLTKDGNLTNNAQFLELIAEPRHYCACCGRVARAKKVLCEPEKLKRTKE